MTRLSVKKTYKLYIGGAFPRSESGRTFEAGGPQRRARVAQGRPRRRRAAARAALPGWAGMTAYNRGQVLYRLAEMMEARATDLERACTGRDEVEAAIDRTVWYAGWADKLAQVLGSSNPVAGPYFDFTVPEPTGVVAILAPAEPPLLGLVSRIAPGARRRQHRRRGRLGEPSASPRSSSPRRSRRPTSRTGPSTSSPASRDELAPWLAGHMDVNAIDLTGVDGATAELERLAAENVKRVVRSSADAQSPWEIEAFLELKTVWHPIGL